MRLLAGSLLTALAVALAGCGGGRATTPQDLRLERADLLTVVHALSAVEAPTAREVTATKAAWPFVANGVSAGVGAPARAAIATARHRAAALTLPGVFAEREYESLTGPGSSIAGSYRWYVLLSQRGWTMIEYAIARLERGDRVAMRFAHDNVALYIESVYDAHYGLAQLGKQLLAAYKALGGAEAFGSSLTEAEVRHLARAYSESRDRLHPHEGVRLGS